MKNGNHFSEIAAEESIVASIVNGRFNDIPESRIVPSIAFFDPVNRAIYDAAAALRRAGATVCDDAVSDFMESLNLEPLLQKFVDPTKTIHWREWYQKFENHKSASLAPTTYSLEYALQTIAKAFEKRQRLGISERITAGTITDEAAIEELRKLSPDTRTLPPMVSAKDLCSKPPPTPPEIIEGLLHQGSKMAFGGGSKSFKTWTLLEISICIATGRDWLGFPTTKGRVLYINFELPPFSIEKRIREICLAMGVEVPENLVIWNLRGHATDAATILPMISREAKASGFLFMVLDPLYKLLGSLDENASRDMANLMNSVERLAVDTNAGVAFGSHFAKGNASSKESMDRISGSGVFARDPDTIITMTQHEQDGAFSVEMTLRNFPPQEPFVVRREHPLMRVDVELDPEKLKTPRGRKAVHSAEDALRQLKDSMTTSEWEAACKEKESMGRTTFFNLKAQLKAEGRIFESYPRRQATYAAEGGCGRVGR